MSALFENLLRTRSAGTLSHSDLGDIFFLGTGINIMSSPAQCLHSFVKRGGVPFKVVVFGRLSSFEVIEDAVSLFLFLQRVSLCFSPFFFVYEFGHFLSVNLCELLPTSCFTEMYYQQLETLQKIEEEEGSSIEVHDQVCAVVLICNVFCEGRHLKVSNSNRSGERQRAILCLRPIMLRIMLYLRRT